MKEELEGELQSGGHSCLSARRCVGDCGVVLEARPLLMAVFVVAILGAAEAGEGSEPSAEERKGAEKIEDDMAATENGIGDAAAAV